MSDEFQDPILDACLDEVLGQATPPDLTQRILHSWTHRQTAGAVDQVAGAADQAAGASGSGFPVQFAGSTPSTSQPIPPPIQVLGGSGPALEPPPPPIAAPGLALGGPPAQQMPGDAAAAARHSGNRQSDAQHSGTRQPDTAYADPAAAAWPVSPRTSRGVGSSRGAGGSRERRGARSKSLVGWSASVVAASVILLGSTLGLWWAARQDRSGPTTVAGGKVTQPQSETELPAGEPKGDLKGAAEGPPRFAGGSGPPSDGQETQRAGVTGGFSGSAPFGVARVEGSGVSGEAGERRPLPDPLSHDEIVAFVNHELREVWRQYEVQPAAPADDSEWCRRVYLRLLGRIPTVDELNRFVAQAGTEKRAQLVDQLLEDGRYAEELADHWSGLWTNVLVGRTGGLNENRPGQRQALRTWLRDALRNNRPFNEIASDLVAATGSTDPADDDFNAAVHYLLINLDENRALATARTTRSLLGKQLQCTQCHQHPSNSWEQRHFWEMNAFFRQMQVERDDRPGHYRLVDRDFPGEGKRDASEAEVYFERLDGKLQAAYPVFLGRESISPSGRLEDVNRRRELARFVADSEDLCLSVVNRTWSHFLGHGFTRTVDDMGPHSPVSHPELLRGLADQFAAHGHDLKSLLRWVTLSEAFGLSSRETAGTLADRPDAAGMPLFSRYYTRQLPPEEVFDSLQLVASARSRSGELSGAEQARVDWLNQFTRDMGTDEANETDTFNGDIRQSLIIMNGPLMRQATTPESGNLLDQVLQSRLTREEKIDHLFLAALSRKPTRRESGLIDKMLRSATDERTALQDIWWALLNSNEFILDH